MNGIFKRWIDEELKNIKGEFTPKGILAKIVEKRGTNHYIGNSNSIARYLTTHNDFERIDEKKRIYRRVNNAN